jgi:GT2 family glycosyltransferase
MRSDQPMVYAVVLAWNQMKETFECVESLLRSRYLDLKIIVLDNGSTDGTAEAVTNKFPSVEVIRTEVNIGMERGYNMGIEYALKNGTSYVLAMNNDTVVDPGMVTNLVRGIQNHPQAGMVSPKIYHYYGDRTRLWCAGARWAAFPPRIKLIGSNAMDGAMFQKDFKLPYATSCCILMSRDAIQKAGLFDPNYYFYYDDWDLSARFWATGYEIWFIADAQMWHKVSMSTQKAEKPDRWWYIMGRSSVRFYLQYKRAWMLVGYTVYFALREAAKLKFRRIFPHFFGVAEGLADHWGWRPPS